MEAVKPLDDSINPLQLKHPSNPLCFLITTPPIRARHAPYDKQDSTFIHRDDDGTTRGMEMPILGGTHHDHVHYYALRRRYTHVPRFKTYKIILRPSCSYSSSALLILQPE